MTDGDKRSRNDEDLQSPSKSSRLFFMNRHSNYSIDSISEEPELTPGRSSSLFNMLEPLSKTRSPARSLTTIHLPTKSIFGSRPSFVAHRSSSISTDEKQVTVDDFADTDSSEDSQNADYSDDFSQIILGYTTSPTSKKTRSVLNDNFIFKEEFDDTDLKNTTVQEEQVPTRPETPKQQSSQTFLSSSKLPSPEKPYNELTEAPVCSAVSKQKLSQDVAGQTSQTDDERATNRANVIPLTNMTTIPDMNMQKYPEPNVTPQQTPKTGLIAKDTPISTRSIQETVINRADRTDGIDDGEIPIHSDQSQNMSNITKSSSTTDRTQGEAKRDTMRSSLSSGELLNRLEYYDTKEVLGSSRDTTNSSKDYSRISHDNTTSLGLTNDELKGTDANLTAGVDSTTELPITLYKVHDKNYDEGNMRWSVYEHNRVSVQSHKPQFSSESGTSVDADEEHNPGSNKESTISPKLLENNSATSRSPRDDTITTNDESHKLSETVAVPIAAGAVLGAVSSGSERNILSVGLATGDTDTNRAVKPSSTSTKFTSRLQELTPNDDETNENVAAKDTAMAPGFPQSLSHHSIIPAVLSDKVGKQNSHEHMFNRLVDSKAAYTYDSRPYDEKTDSVEDVRFYSWTRFWMMMVCGIIVCPIYFMLTMGVFDHSNRLGFYGALYYYNQEEKNTQTWINKYSRVQKMISLFLGLLWFSIVVAMIGVGIGIGTRRE